MHQSSTTRRSKSILIRDSADCLAQVSQAVVQKDTQALDTWWMRKQDAAVLRKVRLFFTRLQGVAITSATSRTPSLKHKCFALLTQVSQDEETFRDTKDVFEAELVRQAAVQHNSTAGQQPDLHHLLAGVSRSTPALHDDLDFRFHMDTQQERMCSGIPPGEAGCPPTCPEFHAGARRSASEATSLDEFPAFLVKSMDRIGLSLLCSVLQALHSGQTCW